MLYRDPILRHFQELHVSELCCIADAMCMRITTGGAGEVCIAIVLTVSVTRTAVRQVCTGMR